MTRSCSLRPRFTYLHLRLLSSTALLPTEIAALPPVDILTVRALLTSALEQYLGMTGSAIPVDILKVEGREQWIRVPWADGAMVVGALSQWVGKGASVGWRVVARGEWLGALVAGDGRDLFGA